MKNRWKPLKNCRKPPQLTETRETVKTSGFQISRSPHISSAQHEIIEITIFSYLEPFFVPWPSKYFRCLCGVHWFPSGFHWYCVVSYQFSMVFEWVQSGFKAVSKQFSVLFTGFHWFPTGLQVSALGYQLFLGVGVLLKPFGLYRFPLETTYFPMV